MKDLKGTDSFLVESLGFSWRNGTELGRWEEMAWVLFIATFPLHSKLAPLPFTILGGEKTNNSFEARIGNP